MPGGPLKPFSMVPVTAGSLFPNIHVSAGTGFKRLEGLGVQASLTSNATWEIAWLLPDPLPTGTLKLLLIAQANATAGAAKVNPTWAQAALGTDPSAASLSAEGTQTITWSSGDNDKLKEVKVILDNHTPTAGYFLLMQLVYESSSWTLAQVSTWYPFLIWE